MNVRTVLCLLAIVGLGAAENDWFVPLGPPPKAAPKQISGGESFPPLPLPATPLRRSERKRQPSAPKLMGKVMWGESATFAWEGGGNADISDWNLCPADLQSLLNKAGRVLGVSYGSETIDLATFHGDPTRLPVLFLSGTRTLHLDAAQWEVLRTYVRRGGMLVFDSVAGSPYFYDSVKAGLAAAFPGETLRTIPSDHPLYHMATDVDKVRYPQNKTGDQPELEGLYVGCRAAVLVSKCGLGCGWDDREVPLLKQAVYYDPESAIRIGINLVAYAVGYAHVGEEEAKPELFGSQETKAPTDELVIGQIVHEGHWNVHPGAAASLLRQVDRNLAVKTSLKRIAVDPAKDDLSGFHFLYLTGLADFHLDAPAAAAVRRFLDDGGTLFINDGLGLKAFDIAVRRELAALLPEARLQPLAPDHPLFSAVHVLDTVRYSPAVLALKPGLTQPVLEGITLGGDLRVIYSPYDVESGWSGCEHPQAKAWDGDSSIRFGENLLLYAATH